MSNCNLKAIAKQAVVYSVLRGPWCGKMGHLSCPDSMLIVNILGFINIFQVFYSSKLYLSIKKKTKLSYACVLGPLDLYL